MRINFYIRQSRAKIVMITIIVLSPIFSKVSSLKIIQFASKILIILKMMIFFKLKELTILLLVFLEKVTINLTRALEINLLK